MRLEASAVGWVAVADKQYPHHAAIGPSVATPNRSYSAA